MYIRRKVYSTAIDENGEEKLFSTTEIMSEESYIEKLYSTGKVANLLRKTKRNIKNAGEEFVAGVKMLAGKDLTPKDVKAIARNQSIGLKKGKWSKAMDYEGKQSTKESLTKSKEAFREAARKGLGAKTLLGRAFFTKG